MTDNKSFRIESMFNKATIWPVGEFHYGIKWEDEDTTHTVPKFHIDTLLKEGHWVVVPEKKDISTLSLNIVVDSTEANKQLAHTITLAKELEEAIKSLRNVLGVEFVTLDIEGIL